MRAMLVLSMALAACGGGDDGSDLPADAADRDAVDAMPRLTVMETVPLMPGELVEGIFTGGPRDHAVIYLTAPVAELDWNIHGHQDGHTQTVYEEYNRMTAEYVFVPPSETDWWLLLRNSGPTAMDVQLRVEMHGDMQWRWQ